MKKFVPLEKQTKKAQKEWHKKQRRTWNGLDPMTRTQENGKAYNRNKFKQMDRRNRGDYDGSDKTSVFLCPSLIY